MPSMTEVEARLRGYAQQYDRDFPPTASVERRIIARVAITPRQPRRALTLRPAWSRTGGLVRELAMVSVVVLLVAALVVGVVKLRALAPRPNSPSIGVKGPKPIGTAYFTGLHFVSADAGWVAESKPAEAGPTVLFKTADGGRSWQQQLTWDGPGPTQVLFSSDGTEGLVVGLGGVPIFRTADGGASWQRMDLPAQATQVALQYFLDAREGWIISYLNEATPGFAGVFHTTDGAQHWTQTARLDVNQLFNHARVGGSLQGNLMFRDSSTGWFLPGSVSGTGVPIVPPFLYITHDGGTTWTVQTLATPAGVQMDSGNSGVSLPEFVNQREGVLFVTVLSIPTGNTGAVTLQGMYAYSTSDGGDHWSGPRPIVFPSNSLGPQVVVVIDASTWVTPSGSGIARTTDAGLQWQALAGGLPADGHVAALQFQNASSGWAQVNVGTKSFTLALYRTTDGGAHWTQVSVPDLGG